MGCVSAKHTRFSRSPDFDHHYHSSSIKNWYHGGSGLLDVASFKGGFGTLEKIKEEPDKEIDEEHFSLSQSRSKRGANDKKTAFSNRFGRSTEGEHVAAGWPAWLSAVAGETIDGWLPLRSDIFDRLDKIGQGTYISVYRARNSETGKMVALKKVK